MLGSLATQKTECFSQVINAPFRLQMPTQTPFQYTRPMSKESRQQKDLKQVQGHDERNIARLALALAQNRVPETLQSWEKQLTVDTLGAIHVKCVARADAVVPHGLDNDIIVGLVNAFVEQGLPTTGMLQLSAYRLLTLAGLRVGGRQYSELLESLRRLQGSTFAITESWFDGKQHQWVSEEFSIISSFARVDSSELAEDIGQLRADTMLEIQLARAITRSVRSGHLRPLDLEFYSQLSQPMVRTLYRSLEERRAPAGKTPSHEYTVTTRVWGEHLGMQDWRLDKVRRALEPAHRELLETQYLIEVIYTGRGEAQQITYRFGKVTAPVDAELVGLLTKSGLNAPTAMKIVQEFPERIKSTISVFQKIISQLRTPVKNRQGLLIDIIYNPEKYAEYFTDDDIRKISLSQIENKITKDSNHNSSELMEEDWETKQATDWATLAPEIREKRTFNLLQMIMSEFITKEEAVSISYLVKTGSLDGLAIARKMTRSMAEKSLSSYAEELRGYIAL